MTEHNKEHRSGFRAGFTAILDLYETRNKSGIALGVLVLKANERYEIKTQHETAWLLMAGEVTIDFHRSVDAKVQRKSLFDDGPSCLHVPANTTVAFNAQTDAEFTVYAVDNRNPFEPKLFQPRDVPTEHRGKGQVGDTCYRFVRTIFDRNNSDPAAMLVLGEVITMPGRWSSYPPHHHPQPEIYHYRFDKPQGFGFSQAHQDSALMLHHNDTVQILPGEDHAQASAPGYAMYYAWVIRHLPNNPYTVPKFTEEHAWVMQPNATIWQPTLTKDKL